MNKILTLVLIITLASCNQMSEFYSDKSAGINGSFEFSKDGLPLNWLVYSPKTVPDSDFSITIDTNSYYHGRQSLRFDVKKSSGKPGRLSPGISSEFFEAGLFLGPAKYKLSYWLKNSGAKFVVYAGATNSKVSEVKTIHESNQIYSDWQYFEHIIDIPNNQWLRMELNILSSGTFSIDNIQIEKI